MCSNNEGEPYWAKPGKAPPPMNPHISGVNTPESAAQTASPALNVSPNAPNPPPDIPIAQPYCPPQASYNVQPRTVNGMMNGQHVQQRAYAVQSLYPGNGQYNVQYVTTTEPYCGPISWTIGLVLCFFTGWGCVVACCPCDSRTVTYVDGQIRD
jgi:hypothetical protein